VAALSSLVADIEDEIDPISKLRIVGPEIRLTSNTELGAFRIVQEAIRNTRRHAEAAHLQVVVTFAPDHVKLTVTDDGKGFNSEDLGDYAPEHLGLLGMSERARLLGGHLELHSSPGHGTEVEVAIPLEGPPLIHGEVGS
jgi:signal transduction histidine kinase